MSAQHYKPTFQKELHIETPNQAGAAGQLIEMISKDARIQSLWSGVMNGKGFFAVITDNNKKVAASLQQNPMFKNVKEYDVIVFPTQNRSSDCATVTYKLGNAGIDIEHFYTSSLDNQQVLIFATKNNQQAAEILSQ